MTEKELIKLAKNGDGEAFEKLTKETLEKGFMTLRKSFVNVNEEDLKDASQVALIKCWEKLKNFREDSSFSTWFCSVLRNELLNVFKEKNGINKFEVPIEQINHQNIVDQESLDYQSPSMLDEAVLETAQTILEKKDEMVEYKKMLEYVLERLSPDHSKVIKLTLDEEKSYKEAASELGLPVGSLMSRLFYARQHAQRLIKQYAGRNEIELHLK